MAVKRAKVKKSLHGDKAGVVVNPSTGKVVYCNTDEKPEYYKEAGFIVTNLYVVVNEPIKDNDWFMSAFYSYPLHNTKEWRNKQKKLLGVEPNLDDLKYHKIVATTDKSLIINDVDVYEVQSVKMEGSYHKSLPQPSEAFIKKYYEVGGIDEVNIELEDCGTGQNPDYILDKKDSEGFGFKIGQRIKVDSHNTITIHPIKNSWTLNEVTELMNKTWEESASQYYEDYGFDGEDEFPYLAYSEKDKNEWIKQTLK